MSVGALAFLCRVPVMAALRWFKNMFPSESVRTRSGIQRYKSDNSFQMPFIDIVDAEQFTDYVNRDAVTIICFSAVWCGPCRQIAKDLDKLAYEFPAANFLKVDADTNPDIFQKCSVTVLPTFLAVRQGKELGHIIGADVKGLKSLLRMIC